MPNKANRVAAGQVYDLYTLSLIKTDLEKAGILFDTVGENHIHLNWLMKNAIGGVRIFVRSSEFAQAQKIILAHQNTVSKFICSFCGSNNYEVKTTRKDVFKGVLFLLLFAMPSNSRFQYVCTDCGKAHTL